MYNGGMRRRPYCLRFTFTALPAVAVLAVWLHSYKHVTGCRVGAYALQVRNGGVQYVYHPMHETYRAAGGWYDAELWSPEVPGPTEHDAMNSQAGIADF